MVLRNLLGQKVVVWHFKFYCRSLVRTYGYLHESNMNTNTKIDEVLAAFNKLMAMEALASRDDEVNYRERSDFHPYEIYQTRLVQVDLGPRAEYDPFRRGIQRTLQRLQY